MVLTVQPGDPLALALGDSRSPLSRIVTLTREHVDVNGPATMLLLADSDWIDLPEPIATLLRSYLKDGWNTHTAANASTNWLFPGGMPGHHLHIHRASDVLRTAGIPVLAARNSTWFQLVREAPPTVLARTLGISPKPPCSTPPELAPTTRPTRPSAPETSRTWTANRRNRAADPRSAIDRPQTARPLSGSVLV